MIAPQKTQVFILVFLLTVLGLELIQPSHSQPSMYQRFLRQHVDGQSTGGTDRYCNTMMRRRGMTTNWCKHENTFIHDQIGKVVNICSNPNIQCKHGGWNCHAGIKRITYCNETGTSQFPNCNYQATAATTQIVIACNGNPLVPVHFDR